MDSNLCLLGCGCNELDTVPPRVRDQNLPAIRFLPDCVSSTSPNASIHEETV